MMSLKLSRNNVKGWIIARASERSERCVSWDVWLGLATRPRVGIAHNPSPSLPWFPLLGSWKPSRRKQGKEAKELLVVGFTGYLVVVLISLSSTQ